MTIDRPTPAQIPQLRGLWQQAFGDSDAFLENFFSTGFSFDRCRCVTQENKPVAALYWFPAQLGNTRLAYLYAVATDAAFRGQGLCHRLMEDTHRYLLATGYEGTLLVPGSDSLTAFYAEMGYVSFSTIKEFSCRAGTQPMALQRISSQDYCAFRRKALPANGVLQEGATLAFLQTQAEFYTGDGVLLAATKVGNTLIVPELLGDTSRAPGIVAQLGAAMGEFRSPGEGRPFAMYRHLTGTPLSSGYFGLALD